MRDFPGTRPCDARHGVEGTGSDRLSWLGSATSRLPYQEYVVRIPDTEGHGQGCEDHRLLHRALRNCVGNLARSSVCCWQCQLQQQETGRSGCESEPRQGTKRKLLQIVLRRFTSHGHNALSFFQTYRSPRNIQQSDKSSRQALRGQFEAGLSRLLRPASN